MNDQNTNPESKTGLIDRRFFLKASTATVVAVAAGTVIPASIGEKPIPAAENDVASIPVATDHNNDTNKHWQAGWMAF